MMNLKAASRHKRHVGWIRGLEALIHLYGQRLPGETKQAFAQRHFQDRGRLQFFGSDLILLLSLGLKTRARGSFIFSSKIEVPQQPPKKGFPGQNDNKSLPCQLLLTTLSYFGFFHHSVSVAWQSNDKHCGGRMGLPASLVSTMVLTGLHPSPRSAYHLEPLPPSLSLTWVGAWAHF